MQPQLDEAVADRDRYKRDSRSWTKAHDRVAELYDELHASPLYFRDSYNGWSLIARLGLSWWGDVLPKLDKEGFLSIEECRWLLDEVRHRRLDFDSESTQEQSVALATVKLIAESVGQEEVTPSVEPSTSISADDVRWFVSQKLALIEFLATAIEDGEPIICSL